MCQEVFFFCAAPIPTNAVQPPVPDRFYFSGSPLTDSLNCLRGILHWLAGPLQKVPARFAKKGILIKLGSVALLLLAVCFGPGCFSSPQSAMSGPLNREG